MSPETAIILEAINDHGVVVNKEVVVIVGSNVFVNSEKLSSIEVITQSDDLKNISHFPRSGSDVLCKEGVFRHTYKKGSKIKIERGCLKSERYEFLSKSFKGLKKDSVTE